MQKLIFKWQNRFAKSYDTGFLTKEDGHSIFYQQVGNPKGQVVLSFHGGPGGSSKPYQATAFDLRKYRVILFDQRGCGQSICQNPVYKNTIEETIKDAARLLDFLKIKEKVIVTGASFGSTCALLFSETFPQKVKRLVVYAIYLGREKDSKNMSSVAPFFYPDVLEDFQKMARKKSVDDYFYDLVFSKKKKDREKALQYYGAFEHQMGEMEVSFPKVECDEKKLTKFQIFMHYQKNKTFLKENQLVKGASRLKGIPTEIYQNRLDFCCPPYQAFEIHKAIKGSTLHILPYKAHICEEMLFELWKSSL
ncbi:MAG: alpha/beta fold hydrolase [Alphaproteobacteria bacterium]|nr:alpha/beta fold hydrolase [Alphaproteobacteria bacterium]